MKRSRNHGCARRSALLAAALTVALLGAYPAHAATIRTGVLLQSATITGACVATNLGPNPIEVRVRIYDYFHKILDFSTNLSSDDSGGFTVPVGVTGWVRCEFTFPGPKRDVRGMLLLDTGGATYAATEAH